MTTKIVTEWVMPKNEAEKLGLNSNFESACDALIIADIQQFLSSEQPSQAGGELFDLLTDEYQKVSNILRNERWVSLTNTIYFDKKAGGCWLIYTNSEAEFYKQFNTGTDLSQVEQHINDAIKDPINQWEIPSKTQLLAITGLSEAPFLLKNKRPLVSGYKILYSINNKVEGIDCDHNCFTLTTEARGLPFLSLSENTASPKALLITFLEKGLTPLALEKSSDYQLLLAVFHRKNKRIFTEQKMVIKKFLQQLYDVIQNNLISTLLNEDKIRADIAPYHAKILEDTDLGHWSLWQHDDEASEKETIILPSQLVARDPNSSLNEGIVGIDFGTKSTVVVYQKNNVNIHPMRIGVGDLSKEIAAFHYENPTIMEFNDLERFRSDYQAKSNKPFTRWQDLTISHTAKNALLGCESSQFNTFLDEIKQWAGDKNRQLKVVGKQGEVIDLPPFLEIGEDDFNPIEIYAYYLGLYINNQNNGIFLDYILSFPVTYEMPIRDKIIESFTKGLQKSLPAELGAETLAKLTVTKGASEPAAYALVALQAFDFDPSDDERIFYSVFDFGGGTTDFDFGIFREATGKKERRFDYVIEHFGAGGDKFLGGENLLELLAFEIFKKNRNALLEKGIQFEKHPEKDAFAGSEKLLNTSQEAKINTKTLCELLRPFWEADKDSSLDLSQGSLSLNLTDESGLVLTGFELDVNEEELNKILYDRIERGVINFFEALRLAFTNSRTSLHDIENVKIFLAGNSSQSSFVKDIFDKHIAIQHEAMQHPEDKESRFELFAPLGVDENDVEKPTGKTGVAFGLIESREGGDIMVIDHNVGEDIRFKFYLGESRKKCFKAIIDRETVFNQWIEFVDAGYQKFELYYTDQPSASTGKMAISDSAIKKNVIKLTVSDEEAMVYLRIVSPTKIEYVVAYEDGLENENYLNAIQFIELT